MEVRKVERRKTAFKIKWKRIVVVTLFRARRGYCGGSLRWFFSTRWRSRHSRHRGEGGWIIKNEGCGVGDEKSAFSCSPSDHLSSTMKQNNYGIATKMEEKKRSRPPNSDSFSLFFIFLSTGWNSIASYWFCIMKIMTQTFVITIQTWEKKKKKEKN